MLTFCSFSLHLSLDTKISCILSRTQVHSNSRLGFVSISFFSIEKDLVYYQSTQVFLIVTFGSQGPRVFLLARSFFVTITFGWFSFHFSPDTNFLCLLSHTYLHTNNYLGFVCISYFSRHNVFVYSRSHTGPF